MVVLVTAAYMHAYMAQRSGELGVSRLPVTKLWGLFCGLPHIGKLPCSLPLPCTGTEMSVRLATPVFNLKGGGVGLQLFDEDDHVRYLQNRQ